jgi:Circularly permutated YpsA SLOG family
MITIVHGGQTGVDRGAHETAISLGWPVDGYMPRDGRDEFGAIPEDVARYLRPHESTRYAARTEANVRSSDAVLVVVRAARDPQMTPGTALTIDLATRLHKRLRVVDADSTGRWIAEWIWRDLLGQLSFEAQAPIRLLVAGPRESKWSSARVETIDLLRRVADALRARSAA